MLQRLVLVDGDLARRVGVGLGIPVAGGRRRRRRDESPNLAMVTEDVYPPDGRVVHVLAGDGVDVAGVGALREQMLAAGVTVHVIAPHKGAIRGSEPDTETTVDRSFHTASSAEADAVLVAAGAPLRDDPIVATYLQSAFRHFKTVGAWGDGAEVLRSAAIAPDAAGVIVHDRVTGELAQDLVAALGRHRHWERAAPHPTRADAGGAS
jgi:catalase